MGWFLVLVLGVSVLNVLWQVFTRYVLGDPSSYTEELARYLLIWIGLVGAAYASGRRLHLAIDLVPDSLGGKARRRLAIAIELLAALFAVSVLIIGGLRLVQFTFSLGQTSAALGLKMGYVYLALPISGFLTVWFAVRDIARLLAAPVEP